ncbi:thiol-disulfide isomerase/thioredoxin [Arcticibacter pallidicorallinus]|uniref:Thiol-disulfide isomerase/thioredoxin n=1 Tax=Arcticibacter pallidicorallinus TaxID=1259464 RepID=A0A2T0U4J1_9SPHI|nr:TlpA disulfide reductase family protein [Arcticibacter pallidicorallinus]PRY52804.1 thiol-disulfide isomerase/thioredoxin [Arcticibacter pallidicorallinus]
MRFLFLIVLTLLTFNSYCQKNVYTFNNGTFFSKDQINAYLSAGNKELPPTHELLPVIYHKAIIKDSIVNYLSFNVSNKTSTKQSSSSEFIYKQDSLYLLLNRPLPAFKLNDLNGKEISSEDLLGKPTLINFWAINCAPCIEEMPQLSRLKERYKDKMNFISITHDSKTRNNLVKFLEDKDFNFQVLELGELYEKELKIGAIPKNLFLDRKGVLRYIQSNYPLQRKSEVIEIIDIDDKDNYFTKIINELIR